VSDRTPAAPSIVGTPAAEVLRRLELSVTRRLDGLRQGDHRGLTPGHGSEPGDIRAYQPGDDVRRIDWNVTARLREPQEVAHVHRRLLGRERQRNLPHRRIEHRTILAEVRGREERTYDLVHCGRQGDDRIDIKRHFVGCFGRIG
jgi:uncharacterized protein (DUF58 family)